MEDMRCKNCECTKSHEACETCGYCDFKHTTGCAACTERDNCKEAE